ncbi:glycoside hydrolase family 15 protein [Deinococcus yavapaiensis]|uniref:Glycosyl hydrolase family 15 n=1 Tax=Deinococcus yavapaiensis KR-236 TaxID=694435 RepID=A0A318S2D9_9DEIO|nr:glycoside hydrolase family 15 protein [Deinococcus yavapaiensis]PYE52701.1 glycosyl hydrolase family 15 [Deinococcus yavapaiensis KR-236]
MRDSLRLLLLHQADSGAFPACPTFSQYPYAWLRDGTFVAYALDRGGEHAAAERFYRWALGTIASLEEHVRSLVAKRERNVPISDAEFLPTRFALSGDALGDDWPNFQLDGYGQVLWGLAEHLKLSGKVSLPSEFERGVHVTVTYLRTFWNEPCYDCWEEFPYRWHTSTLASLYGGLHAIQPFVPEVGDLPERLRSFTRTHLVQGSELVKFSGFPFPDASLLWAGVPFGLVDLRDPVFAATLARVERDLVRGGVYRYAFDTYYGGGRWVLLTAWLGWVYARLGRTDEARRCLKVVQDAWSAHGLPEQMHGELLTPAYEPYWRDRWGQSANPLLWSHAMHVVLEAELAPTLVETP